MDEAEAVPNIRLNFEHKVTAADLDQRELVVWDGSSGAEHRVGFDLCIGADGSYSVIRRQLMRVVRLVDRFSLVHADLIIIFSLE